MHATTASRGSSSRFRRAIQNWGPIIRPGDRYEGYAAERNELLKFIDQNHIENVVFVTADTHWTSVNNLTYQEFFGGPQIATSVIDVNTISAGIPSFASLVPAVRGLNWGSSRRRRWHSTTASRSRPIPTTSPMTRMISSREFSTASSGLGYDPIGLDDNLPAAAGKVNAQLLQGDYFVGHRSAGPISMSTRRRESCWSRPTASRPTPPRSWRPIRPRPRRSRRPSSASSR